MIASAFGIVLTVGIGLAVWLGSHGLPCPTSDDAAYRSPAAELVQHGRLAAPGMSSYVPRTAVTFAYYPPLYPLVLSGWFWLFGFSLRSSLAFSYTVHMLNALAIMEVTRRAIAGDRGLSALGRCATIAATGLIQVANVAYLDRPEETALLFVWVEVLWVQERSFRSAVASGVLLGLAGLTGPWVGVLGSMVVVFRTMLTTAGIGETASHWLMAPQATGELSSPIGSRGHASRAGWIRTGLRLSVTALVGAILVSIWMAIIETTYPGILHDQFFGVMRHVAGNQGPPSLRKNLGQFAKCLLFNRSQLPILVLTLVLFPVLCGEGRWRRLPPTLLALFAAGVSGIGIMAVLRPDTYTYLGAARILMLPCFGAAFGRYLQGPTSAVRLGLGVLAFCTAFTFQPATTLVAATWTLPPEERCDDVCHRLTTIIPPGELVDLTGRHWYCFQDRNPWAEAYFIRDHPEDLLRARWLVLAKGIGQPACLDAFEMVEEIASTADPELTYAYSLWRRRGR
jgi:hypothetical protein